MLWGICLRGPASGHPLLLWPYKLQVSASFFRNPAHRPGGRCFRTLPWIFLCVDRRHAGASAAFVIGRTLGREFAASLIGDRLKKYDEAIERNGFATVLYLRLVYFPFHPHEFRHGSYPSAVQRLSAGTGLGIVAAKAPPRTMNI